MDLGRYSWEKKQQSEEQKDESLQNGKIFSQKKNEELGGANVFASVLLKRRKNNNEYQRRWFVLDYNTNVLKYYENEKNFASGKQCKGEIFLNHSGVNFNASENGPSFNIKTKSGQPDEYTYYLQAIDFVSRTAWITELESALARRECECSLYKAADITDHTRMAGWKVSQAPLPNDIVWENIGAPKFERVVRWSMTTLAVFNYLAVATGFAVLGMCFISFDYLKIIYHIDAVPEINKMLENVKEKLGLLFYILWLPPGVLFLAIAATICPLLKFWSKFERNATRTIKQATYFSKAFLFYSLPHYVLSICAFAVLATLVDVEHKLRVFVELTGAMHCNMMLSKMLMFLPLSVMKNYSLFRMEESKASVQKKARFREMVDTSESYGHSRTANGDIHNIMEDDESNENMMRRPNLTNILSDEDEAHFSHSREHFSDNFDYTEEYTKTITVFTMVIITANFVPIILPFAALFFMSKFICDKYMLKAQFSRNRTNYGRRVMVVTKFTLVGIVYMEICMFIYTWFFIDNHLVAVISTVKLVLAVLIGLLFKFRKLHFMDGLLGYNFQLLGFWVKRKKSKQKEAALKFEAEAAAAVVTQPILYQQPSIDNQSLGGELAVATDQGLSDEELSLAALETELSLNPMLSEDVKTDIYEYCRQRVDHKKYRVKSIFHNEHVIEHI